MSAGGCSHVVAEKPLAHDLQSSEELAKAVKEVLHEVGVKPGVLPHPICSR